MLAISPPTSLSYFMESYFQVFAVSAIAAASRPVFRAGFSLLHVCVHLAMSRVPGGFWFVVSLCILPCRIFACLCHTFYIHGACPLDDCFSLTAFVQVLPPKGAVHVSSFWPSGTPMICVLDAVPVLPNLDVPSAVSGQWSGPG